MSRSARARKAEGLTQREGSDRKPAGHSDHAALARHGLDLGSAGGELGVVFDR
jgi:hypothetical protein